MFNASVKWFTHSAVLRDQHTLKCDVGELLPWF